MDIARRRAAPASTTQLDLPLPARAGELDRGRHHGDPQEHHRRARARPARGLAGSAHELRLQRRAAGDQGRRQASFLASRYKLERVRELRRVRAELARRATWKEMSRARLARHLRWPRSTAARGSGMVELVILMEELGYALAPTPLFSNAAAGLVLQRPAPMTSRRSAGCGRWRDGELRGTAGAGRRRNAGGDGELVRRAATGSRRARRRDRAGDGRRQRRRLLVATATAAGTSSIAKPMGASVDRRRADRPDPEAVHCALRGRRVPAGSTLTGAGGEPAASQRGCWRSRPSSSGSPSARWRWPSSTPRTASSSTGRSAPTRPSRTAAPQMLLETESSRSAVYYAAWAADAEPETLAAGRLDGEGLRLRCRLACRACVATGARRDRLHLGARPAFLVPEARPSRRRPVRRREATIASASPSVVLAAGARGVKPLSAALRRSARTRPCR